MRPSRLPLLLRGSVAAAIATFMALVSHVAAGGELPGWLGITVPLLLSTMVCVLLAGRRLSLARLTVAVSASQFLFHTLFVLGSITPLRSMGHQHGAPLVLAPLTDGVALPDAGMWLGHVIAASATTALLHRGESAVRQLLRLAQSALAWVARTLTRTPALPLEVRPRSASQPIADDARVHIARRVVSRMPHRGPPLPSAL